MIPKPATAALFAVAAVAGCGTPETGAEWLERGNNRAGVLEWNELQDEIAESILESSDPFMFCLLLSGDAGDDLWAEVDASTDRTFADAPEAVQIHARNSDDHLESVVEACARADVDAMEQHSDSYGDELTLLADELTGDN